MNDHTSRMISSAQDRIHDADILSTSLSAASDSAALLRILALEILLKAWLHSTGTQFKRSHDYRAMWAAFSPDAQRAVLHAADDIDPGLLRPEAVPNLLANWEFVFKRARYYYEFYETHTLAEQRTLGEGWLERGAPEEEAQVRYYPYELRALTHGLIAHIQNAA